ncbi:15693_t:CDS:2, partial [Gigaspora rosea]
VSLDNTKVTRSMQLIENVQQRRLTLQPIRGIKTTRKEKWELERIRILKN